MSPKVLAASALTLSLSGCYIEVYGDGRMPSGQRGIASAANSRGTYVNCAHRGTGACLFSNGAKHQLHFGG